MSTWTPSIVPNDRLDRDFYIVLEDFKNGAAFRETDEGIDYATLIDDLLHGQYDQVLRVVAFNPAEGWSRDASEDVARELNAAWLRAAKYPIECKTSSRASSAARSACNCRYHCRDRCYG